MHFQLTRWEQSVSESEARDAYVAVELELPNGQQLRGRPIPWKAGMQIKVLLLAYMGMPTEENRAAAFQAFSASTGITEQQIFDLDPDVTIGEMIDLINRFTLLLRPGRTAAGRQETPARTGAPPPTAPAPSPSV